MKNKLIKWGVLLLSMSIILSTSLMAEPQQRINTPNERNQQLDGVESFADDFFNSNMANYNIPGAAVIIVKNGQVILSKGYGYSDLQRKETFSPSTTTFRIASITKLFTATALMQLIEEGKVDLEEDIQTYLPHLKVNNPYNKPVTVGELLTHSSGIDSSIIEDLSYEKATTKEKESLVSLLNKRNITVTYEPGKFIEYSSYGTVVAGAIVEEVSGMSCEEYIRTNILEPLNMTQTQMAMEDTNLSKGYLYNGKSIQESTLTGTFKLYPEGGLLSNTEDMGKYINMFLENETYKHRTVLNQSTLQEMMKTHIRFSEYLPGMCYGFAEYFAEGNRVIGHGGYSPDGFLSQLDLYPDEGIGTFVIVNQGSNSNITDDFRKAFAKAYLMKQTTQNSQDAQATNESGTAKDNATETNTTEANITNNSVSENSNRDLEEVIGTYRFSDYSKTTVCKADVFGGIGEIKITRLGKDTIQMSGMDNYTYAPFVKEAACIGGLTYKVKNSEEYIVFKTNDKRQVSCMAESSSSSHGIYEKLKWYETSAYQMTIFVVALAAYCLQLIIGFVFLVRKFILRCMKKVPKADKATLKVSELKIISIVSGIAFLNVGFLTYSLLTWGQRLRYGLPMDILICLAMPILSTVLTVILLILMIRQQMREKEKAIFRVYNAFMLIISILFIWILNDWNLLGYKL